MPKHYEKTIKITPTPGKSVLDSFTWHNEGLKQSEIPKPKSQTPKAPSSKKK